MTELRPSMADPKMPAFDKELVQQLGRVVLAHGQLTTVLQVILMALVDVDQRVGWVVASHLGSFSSLADCIHALYITRNTAEDAHYAQLANLLARGEEVTRRRNKIIHSGWSLSEEGIAGRVRAPRMKKGWTLDVADNVQPSEVRALVTEINAVSSEATKWYKAAAEAGSLVHYTYSGSEGRPKRW